MKRFLLPGIVVLIFVLTQTTCKKPNDNENTGCYDSKFLQEHSIKIRPTYINEDNKGNILILGNWDNIIQIVKLDGDGNLIWHKSYPELKGKEHGLTFIDENAFFINASTDVYEYTLSNNLYENAWINNGIYLNESNNYVDAYELGDIIPQLQNPNTNKSFLTKINTDGNIVWTKEFDGCYCEGNSLYRIDQNNFLFLTADFFGPYFELVEYDGKVDTINAPDNKNNRVLYKIDAEGNTNWSTTINDVFEVAKAGDDFYYNIRHSVTLNNDRILVNVLTNTYELTLDGVLFNEFQPIYNYQGNHTYYMIKAASDENYLFSTVNNKDSFHFYSLYKYDVKSHQVIWENDKSYFPIQISSTNTGELLTLSYQNKLTLEKFNSEGTKIWQKEFESSSGLNKAMTASCNGGALLAVYDTHNQKIAVYKTDASGNY